MLLALPMLGLSFLLFFLPFFQPQASAGFIDYNVLVCGAVTGYDVRKNETLPILTAYRDLNNDHRIDDAERQEKPLPYRIKTFSHMTAPDARDLESLVSTPTQGYKLCVFGDIHSNLYDSDYYLVPKNFDVYSPKTRDVLLPSEISALETQALAYLENICPRNVAWVSLRRLARNKLIQKIRLLKPPKGCPSFLSNKVTKDKNGAIHVELGIVGIPTKIPFDYSGN